MKFCVVIARTGCVFIEAESEAQAMDIANHQKTDAVSWSEDWGATDAFEDDSALQDMYIDQKAFE